MNAQKIETKLDVLFAQAAQCRKTAQEILETIQEFRHWITKQEIERLEGGKK